MIEYTSYNGYRGVLYGKKSLSIYSKDGQELLHTGSRAINTLEELKEYIEGFQEFYETLLSIPLEKEAKDETDEI